jgi:GTPase
VSAATREGTSDLTFAMARLVQQRRSAMPQAEPTRIVIRPKAVDDTEFTVVRDGEVWRVTGRRPERWVRQTDFANDEAVGYLADRLNRLGVEDRLRQLGAEPGDAVAVGSDENAVIFDFDPSVETGAELLRGPRGSDPRLEGR